MENITNRLQPLEPPKAFNASGGGGSVKTIVFNGRLVPLTKPMAVNVASPKQSGYWLVERREGQSALQLHTRITPTPDQIERSRNLLGWTWVKK